MKNIEILNNLNEEIERITHRLKSNPSNLEMLEIELYNLNEYKKNYTILSNNGLEFNFVKQFNTECDDDISVKTIDGIIVTKEQSFHDNIITKYDRFFGDCRGCGKAKDEMEVQVYVSYIGIPACFDCFEKVMKNDFLMTNCDFEIIHLSSFLEYDSISKFGFLYGDIRIEFDEFYFRKNDNENYTIYFYITQELDEIREIGLIDLDLTKLELNFLKSQYNLRKSSQYEGV